MIAAAYTLTGGSLADRISVLMLWGSAAAAVVGSLVVLTNGWSPIGWAAVGYIVFAASIGTEAAAIPPLLLLLALSFTPVLPRPRGSLVLGLLTAAATALTLWLAFDRFFR